MHLLVRKTALQTLIQSIVIIISKFLKRYKKQLVICEVSVFKTRRLQLTAGFLQRPQKQSRSNQLIKRHNVTSVGDAGECRFEVWFRASLTKFTDTHETRASKKGDAIGETEIQ